MPKLTTPEQSEKMLRQAYDDQYYSSRRRLVRFALGEKYGQSASINTSLSGELPDDVDMMPQYNEPGQSHRMLTNACLMAAKVCSLIPDPDYPEKDPWKEIVTKAFDKALWDGRPYMGPTKAQEFGPWQPECQRAFFDGDNLGTGFVQIGVRDGWTCIQHHPVGRVIWDRHRLGVSRARYIAFIHHLSEDEAVAMFGNSIRKEVQVDTHTGSPTEHLPIVKAIQYFDMGLGDHDPTEIWRLQNLCGKVLDVSENEYGCLPFAHMEHIHIAGMRRHAGRWDFQVANQVMRNAYERYLRLVLERGPGFDAVDVGKMHPEDQEAFEDGELLAAMRFEVPPLGKIGDYIQRVPPHEPPQGLFAGLQYLDRMEPGESGISDADRANVTASPRTLGEIEQVQAGADTQQAWSERQYTAFLERLFHKANLIAAKLHRAPTVVSVNGVPFLINEPGVPQSNLEYWLTPQTMPKITEDAYSRANPLRRMQIADAKWMPLMQDPLMNPIEVRRALLMERGEKDVDKFLNQQAVQGGMAQPPVTMTDAMAQPMQPGMGQEMAPGMAQPAA